MSGNPVRDGQSNPPTVRPVGRATIKAGGFMNYTGLLLPLLLAAWPAFAAIPAPEAVPFDDERWTIAKATRQSRSSTSANRH